MFRKVLIANRGETALRIHRTCKDMGIQTVAVHSTADEDAMHVRLADEAICIGPPPSRDSYLNMWSLLSVAHVTDVDAIHPGIGFLAENSDFAEAVEQHGHTFIGPSPEHIRVMGDKVLAKQKAIELGIPVVPGSPGVVETDSEALKIAEDLGYPVLIKASAGGGGRGMKIASSREEMVSALAVCRSEAASAFGSDAVYLEKYLEAPRHIEIQVLGDGKGQCLHLGERDCSLQRRHQKVIEEAPSPALDEDMRARMTGTATEAMAQMGYRGVGTIEFLYEKGRFYFIEMNTRLQVEHPVTEMLYGIDLVREQIRVAAGEPLRWTQDQLVPKGHAIECRINAEHPETFMPSPGCITDCHPPGGPGVRFDSHIYSGYTVPPYYDSLLAKLIVHDEDRASCVERVRRALRECLIDGVHTNLPLLGALLKTSGVAEGTYNIHWLENWMKKTEK